MSNAIYTFPDYTFSDTFRKLNKHRGIFYMIRNDAWKIHDNVNQKYDQSPYGYHLDMVADMYVRYISDVEDEHIFAAFFHDTIEDARLTYNDVLKIAKVFLKEDEAISATEIVYALTSDKGRNRAEREGEKYWMGIKNTPGASLIKVCDRAANMTYSKLTGSSMYKKYKAELPTMLASINLDEIPSNLIEYIKSI